MNKAMIIPALPICGHIQSFLRHRHLGVKWLIQEVSTWFTLLGTASQFLKEVMQFYNKSLRGRRDKQKDDYIKEWQLVHS
jgi:hypothetical protein